MHVTRLTIATLVALAVATSARGQSSEPSTEPVPADVARVFEQLARFEPRSPFQQLSWAAGYDPDVQQSQSPALPSKSAPEKSEPQKQSPVMAPPIEYHYHYHAPALERAAPVMAAPQQAQAPVFQQPVMVAAPTAIQAVTTTTQVPAVVRPAGPIRRMIGDAAYMLSRIDDTRVISRQPRVRPVAASSSTTATHVITTTTTQPAVAAAPAQQPVFAAPPPPMATPQR